MSLILDTPEKIERYYNEVVSKSQQLVETYTKASVGFDAMTLKFPPLKAVQDYASNPLIPYLLTGTFTLYVSSADNSKSMLVEMTTVSFDFRNAEFVTFDPSANQRRELKDYTTVHLNGLADVLVFLSEFSLKGYNNHGYNEHRQIIIPYRPTLKIDLGVVTKEEKFFGDYSREELQAIVEHYEKLIELGKKFHSFTYPSKK